MGITIRDEHVLLQSRIVAADAEAADAHRPLVNIQKMTDPVSGAVQIVQTDVPERLSRQRIQELTLCHAGNVEKKSPLRSSKVTA